jgi:dihydrolipoamide dehydrogenase
MDTETSGDRAKLFDLIVIGAGPGGYVGAIRAAQLGMTVAIVDKSKSLGGTCLNIGCIPSKALLESSELYFQALHHLEQHGIQTGSVKFDLNRIMERKKQVVGQLTRGVQTLLEGNGVDVFTGSARILPAGENKSRVVEVSRRGAKKQHLRTRRVLIASGSIPVELPTLPFDFQDVLSSTEALSFERVPKRLVVIGAGAIGLEMGSVWSRLGSEVTVIELLPQIMPGWDLQLARRMNQVLKRQGMNLVVNTRVTGFEKKKGSLQVHAVGASDEKKSTYTADKILVSVGRKPFHEGVGLDENGITWDRDRGFIEIDENYRTSVEGVYAIGDVVGGPMLAHKAEEEAVVCAERMAGIPTELNYDAVPGIIYTAPEIASVGQSEEQLKEAGREYGRGIFHFKANGRALALGDTEGFVKVLADSRTDEVLGVHIIGPRASELISEAVTVMEFGGSAEDIARTVHAHPTLPEVMKEAALAVEQRAIHALS